MSPVNCCIFRNYYASTKDHTKAFIHYDQALRIDQYYSSAWTLMGHELLPQESVQEAADTYSRAVRLNPMDIKALCGLGQTHEQSDMHSFALHYFEKAAVLKKGDDRFWTALGISYSSPAINRLDMAISCFETAIKLGDMDGSAMKNLVTLEHLYGTTM